MSRFDFKANKNKLTAAAVTFAVVVITDRKSVV